MSDSHEVRPTRGERTLERILEVTRQLAAPFELGEMLTRVIDAARLVLDADRGSVFLYDERTHELVLRVATGIDELRMPADRGIAGECAQARRIINVADCYADPRFNPEVDRQSGYRTRCLLAVPLIGHDDALVGVLQLLNRREGTFDAEDERTAAALGAQCAVALQRVRMTEALVLKEKMQRELAVAREIQMGFLPRKMPQLEGYELAGTSTPADQTGGDTFDVVAVDRLRAMILLGDATGHGVGPALSATQVRAMFRIARRLGADLEATLTHINDQLEQDLANNRMVTAFLGTLDAGAHRLTYHAAGQGPLLHFHAADSRCEWKDSTALPLGFLSPLRLKPATTIELAPGDIFAAITDGVFEAEDPRGAQYGTAGVEAALRRHGDASMAELAQQIVTEVAAHLEGAPQADDITIVLARRRGA